MQIIVQILIFFFCSLILYQTVLATREIKHYLQEGFQEGFQDASQYKEYNTSDPNNLNGAMILSQQNAGNIDYLKKQVEEVLGLKKQVNDITENVDKLNDQVIALTQQQQEAAGQLAGDKPVDISGM